MQLKAYKRLGKLLVEKSLISEEGLSRALDMSEAEDMRFGEACVKLGIIGERDLAITLSEQYGLKFVETEAMHIDDEALDAIPYEALHGARVVPMKDPSGEGTFIVTSDPTDISAIDDIERIIRQRGRKVIGRGVATVGAVSALLATGKGSRKMLTEAVSGFGAKGRDASRKQGEEDNVLSLEKISQDSSPVIKVVDTAIYDALAKRASDIHMESTADGLIVKYRLDGVLHAVMGPLDKNFQASIISRIKVMSELDISEKRIPQDGRFKVKLKEKTIDFRVSIMPSIYGEDAVIRILDKENITKEFRKLSLDSLGFGEPDKKLLRRLIREPYGMVLVTGPTGSGKTTTLYAAVSEINTGEDKIITIEDPVEYELKGVVQIPVNEKKGLTFAKGLRSILRHDPDKILVGEIRDPETAQIAIQAALTGHLVFTTVHANNVFDVIGRFIHMGIEPYNFVSSLNCVMAQRLLRLVCDKCRAVVSIDNAALEASGIDAKKAEGAVFYAGKGCPECFNTGYSGRKAILEILDLSDDIKDMIGAKQPVSAIKKKAAAEGMRNLRQAAIDCLFSGHTTLEEINRVTFVEENR
ncbi:MAG: ATPase, T2SS/T4P/T4SS family [Deltaproteobacteria bacterium]|nr:ATPase, T2SS/T4P/T4SS family [Deltaproteobacteria bacterium]